MKVHLGQIPEEGLQRRIHVQMSALPRVVAAFGEQPGELQAALRLRDHEGHVEVKGRMAATVQAPCQRCLDPVPVAVEEEVWLTLAPRKDYEAQADDITLGAGDLDVSFYEGEEIDLLAVLEDEVLLAVPEPVAPEDEEGRCAVCGRNVDELLPEEERAPEEHPFFRMKDLLDKD